MSDERVLRDRIRALPKARALALGPVLVIAACAIPTPGPLASRAGVDDARRAQPQDEGAPASRTDRDAGRQGDWEFTIGGGGSNDNDFNRGGLQLAGAVGYYVTDDFVLLLRQNVEHADTGSDTSNGSTRVALDYVPLDGTVQPFVGCNIGYTYGESVNETVSIAPEIGMKVYLQDRTFLQVTGEFQEFVTATEDDTEDLDTGQFVYSISMGVNF